MTPRRFLALAAPLFLAACGGGGDDAAPAPPTGPPPPAAAAYNVQTCLDQVIRPGMTTANIVVPDTIKLDLTQPTSFPNGRHITDSAIDRTVAFLFMDVPRQGLDVLARLPLGPPANDVPFRSDRSFFTLQNDTAMVLQIPLTQVRNGDNRLDVWVTTARFGGLLQ